MICTPTTERAMKPPQANIRRSEIVRANYNMDVVTPRDREERYCNQTCYRQTWIVVDDVTCRLQGDRPRPRSSPAR
jgi:hypothetical protein